MGARVPPSHPYICRHEEQTVQWGVKSVVHMSHSLCEHNYCLYMSLSSLICKDTDPVTPHPRHTHTLLFLPASVGPSSCFYLENRSDPHPQPVLWGCRGLCGRMWTQRSVSHRRRWPKTYWILGAVPGALGQLGRLRVSRAGLELRHLQEPKWGVLSTEDSPHPWVVGVEMGLGWCGASTVLLSALDTYVLTLRGDSERAFFYYGGKTHIT